MATAKAMPVHRAAHSESNNHTAEDTTDGNHLLKAGNSKENHIDSDNESSFHRRERERSGGGGSGKDGDKERKIGHRRVDDAGQVSYKKIATNHLMGSIQLGIQFSLSAMARYDERDLLMQDFMTVETVSFPKNGSQTTPAHPYSDFTCRTVAPLAFRYFLNLFGVRREDFMMSICNETMRELSNPGASGSIFYLTSDDEFILKTVQHKEAEFLQKLLAGYYMNLNQNPHTLLPKFFGMYIYQTSNQKNIRLTVMNNLLPSNVKMHLKFDLKGSTYKRKANKHERAKKSPTFKDLDFMEMLPDGLLLEAETYNALISTLRRDCRVLESFRIMDYSLLVGIHNLDQAAREDAESSSPRKDGAGAAAAASSSSSLAAHSRAKPRFSKQSVSQKQKLLAHSTAMESIQAQTDPIDEQEHLPPGGIPARNHKGERLLLFLGIIDILQSYRMKKKLEHTIKSIILDGDTVSVHRPRFYAHRFLDFMADRVFKKIPSPLKHSPSRRSKRDSVKKSSVMMTAAQANTAANAAAAAAEKASRENPPSSADNTPPAARRNRTAGNKGASVEFSHQHPAPPSSSSASNNHSVSPSSTSGAASRHPDVVPAAGGSSHVSRPRNRLHEQVKQGSTDVSSDRLSDHSGDHGTPSRLSVGAGSCGWNTPTPTWTEGTPSYTESSYSGGGGASHERTGATPSRSRGTSRDSLGTRSWRGSPYHETEITRL